MKKGRKNEENGRPRLRVLSQAIGVFSQSCSVYLKVPAPPPVRSSVTCGQARREARRDMGAVPREEVPAGTLGNELMASRTFNTFMPLDLA